MDEQSWAPQLRPNGWTREHIYPQATTGRRLLNNVVLAHQKCNGVKAARQPTRAEVLRALAIYREIGLEAFVTLSVNQQRPKIPPTPVPFYTDDVQLPPLAGQAKKAFEMMERYAMMAGDRIQNRVPVCIDTISAMAEAFTKARAQQLARLAEQVDAADLNSAA